MAAEGQSAGLTTVYFGAQKALSSGTTVSVDVIPLERRNDEALRKEYQSWLKDFKSSDTFKLMVQQKANTDGTYAYPDKEAESLALNENDLAPGQRKAASEIEKALSGQ